MPPTSPRSRRRRRKAGADARRAGRDRRRRPALRHRARASRRRASRSSSRARRICASPACRPTTARPSTCARRAERSAQIAARRGAREGDASAPWRPSGLRGRHRHRRRHRHLRERGGERASTPSCRPAPTSSWTPTTPATSAATAAPSTPSSTRCSSTPRVMSAPAPERRVVDAGLKAFAVDSGMPLPWQLPGAVYHRPSDEHGILDAPPAAERPRRGDKVLLVPGHCDPTVNLHDWYVGVRGFGSGRARASNACGRWRPAARCSDFVRVRQLVSTMSIGHCEAVIATRYVAPVTHPGRDAMTPEERQLITGLFDRMRSYGSPEKDREAEALINQRCAPIPMRPTCSCSRCSCRSRPCRRPTTASPELEEQLRELQGRRAGHAARSRRLPRRLFGAAGRGEEPRSQRAPDRRARAPRPGTTSRAADAAGSPRRPQQQPAAGAGGGGGGFMRSALATAAGVAGGMLLADSHPQHDGRQRARQPGQQRGDCGRGEQAPEYADERDNDPGTDRAASNEQRQRSGQRRRRRRQSRSELDDGVEISTHARRRLGHRLAPAVPVRAGTFYAPALPAILSAKA